MKIESLEQIRSILGSPKAVAEHKIYDQLNPRMVKFIQHSPLLFVSTVDEAGFPTISPKGDHPGFVAIENTHSLLIPERKGNKLAFSFSNILNGSKVGLMFVVPGTNEVLRVQGSAELLHDDDINQQLASATQKALLATRFTVNTSYFHCAKAFLRSKLFADGANHVNLKVSFGEELANNGAFEKEAIEEYDHGVNRRYRSDL